MGSAGKRLGHVRISGGQMACQSCRQWGPEVVLLEPDRPLCLRCAGDALRVDADTLREWLRSGKLRGVNRRG